MLGAIIGDIVGSRFEWNNNKSKEFEFLTYKNYFTDDSVMSLSIAKALLESRIDYADLSENAVKYMREFGRKYPDCGYGTNFKKWINSDEPIPYNSFGNGAAMRISACAYFAKSLDETIKLSKIVTEVTHNHPEGIKGAEATAVAIYLAKSGYNLLEIRDYIDKNYYSMNFKLDEIRDKYDFNETCQGTVPQAIEAFLESTSFEDAIRNAISIGGDSDTIAAITGSIAEAYYGIPSNIRKHIVTYLDESLLQILIQYESKISYKIEKKKNRGLIKIESNKKAINIGGRDTMINAVISNANDDENNNQNYSEEISSQTLFNHLFEACNILRGPINQDEYKSYVTPILFFKRISDVYDEETEKALIDSGRDEEYAAFPENHSFIIPDGCHWIDVRNASVNVGTVIVNAMSGIERANPDTLSGVFSSFDDATWTDKSKLSDDRLKDLIEHMSKINVGNNNYSSDVMGDSYEFLIKKFADLSKKNAGEFYTPRSIVRLLVNLLDPKPGDEVYDPACGTGGMLIESIHHIDNNRLTYGRIYGQEKNLSTSAIARMNLFLHGAKDFKVFQGDTLRDPKFLRAGKIKTFDCVIGNPPFGLDKWGAEQFSSDAYGRNIWGSPTDSNADFAWLQHMVTSMDPKKGRCAIILPQGVLFKNGKESQMREKLVVSDKIECIITFPTGVFYSTGVPACAILLNNDKLKSHKNRICLINATEIYTPNRAQKIMSSDDVDKVFSYFQNYEDVDKVVKIVTIKDVKEKHFNLSVNSYLGKKEIEVPSFAVAKDAVREAFTRVKEASTNLSNILSSRGENNESK